MTKLYKKSDNQLSYWECWENDEETSVTHWGIVGERGSNKIVGNDIAEKEIQAHKQRGYVEFDELEIAVLIIEYVIEGMGTAKDLDKRHAVENRMNETLGWVGLGHCDGGSIGSGTMEICCLVVDFDTAKKIIELDLSGTEYRDYNKIYLEGVMDN